MRDARAEPLLGPFAKVLGGKAPNHPQEEQEGLPSSKYPNRVLEAVRFPEGHDLAVPLPADHPSPRAPTRAQNAAICSDAKGGAVGQRSVLPCGMQGQSPCWGHLPRFWGAKPLTASRRVRGVALFKISQRGSRGSIRFPEGHDAAALASCGSSISPRPNEGAYSDAKGGAVGQGSVLPCGMQGQSPCWGHLPKFWGAKPLITPKKSKRGCPLQNILKISQRGSRGSLRFPEGHDLAVPLPADHPLTNHAIADHLTPDHHR